MVERGTPLVSVCIPSYDSAAFIDDALASALGQTYERLEVVVVDDASGDGTPARLHRWSDPRLRVRFNKVRIGANANRNHVCRMARGELVKFLDSDDLLDPECVSKMADLFMADPEVGLAFSRRRIVSEQGDGEMLEDWQHRYRVAHGGFSRIERVNDGAGLFQQWLAAGLHENWIGEPSTAMVRRDLFWAVGGFSNEVIQTVDADLWLRLLSRTKVGFLDEELVSYRRRSSSYTDFVKRSRRDWTDRLWTLEALARDHELYARFPALKDLLKCERRRAIKTALRLGHVRGSGARVPISPYLRYLYRRIRFRPATDRRAQ